MTRDDAVALVKQGLGFRKDLDDEIVVAMAKAVAEFEGPHRTLPEFLIEEDAPLVVPALTQNVTLPTGFLKMVEGEGPNYATNEDGRIFLPRQDFNKAEVYYIDMDDGRPRSYALRKNSLRFWPRPDIEYSLAWSYYKSSPIPVAGTNSNLWLDNWPYLLIARAGMFIAEDTQQNEGENSAYARFSRSYSDWNILWVSHIAGREDDNAPKALGSNY